MGEGDLVKLVEWALTAHAGLAPAFPSTENSGLESMALAEGRFQNLERRGKFSPDRGGERRQLATSAKKRSRPAYPSRGTRTLR